MSPQAHTITAPRVSIIVPTFNEAANLEAVLPTLPPVHEVIVVDGPSTDGTAETAKRVMPSCKVIKQTRCGKGNAMACGFAEATGDILVMFDADGSADAREIMLMVAALVNGADFVKGSRMLHGGGSADITMIRSTGNRVLTGIVNKLFKTRYTDLCYGYNAFWRDTLEVFELPDVNATTPQWGDGFEIETLLNCRAAAAGLTILEVPSYEHDRIHGTSNLNACSDGMRVLKTINTERRRMRSMTRTQHDTVRPKERHLHPSTRFSVTPRHKQLATAGAPAAGSSSDGAA